MDAPVRLSVALARLSHLSRDLLFVLFGAPAALSGTTSSANRLTSSSLAGLSRAKPSAVTSDTDNAPPGDDGFSTDTDTTDASVDGDSDDAEEEARRPARNSSSAARKSAGGARR